MTRELDSSSKVHIASVPLGIIFISTRRAELSVSLYEIQCWIFTVCFALLRVGLRQSGRIFLSLTRHLRLSSRCSLRRRTGLLSGVPDGTRIVLKRCGRFMKRSFKAHSCRAAVHTRVREVVCKRHAAALTWHGAGLTKHSGGSCRTHSGRLVAWGHEAHFGVGQLQIEELTLPRPYENHEN